MLPSPWAESRGFNQSMTLGVFLAVCWMLFRAIQCSISGCGEYGLDFMFLTAFVLLANTLTILSCIPVISVFSNTFRKYVTPEDAEVVFGLLGGLAVYYCLDDWKGKSFCMRELTCAADSAWISGPVFYNLQNYALNHCGVNTGWCFRYMINLHWYGLTVVAFLANYALAQFLQRNLLGDSDGGESIQSCTLNHNNATPQAHLREQVRQNNVTLLREVREVSCGDCRGLINEILTNAQQGNR